MQLYRSARVVLALVCGIVTACGPDGSSGPPVVRGELDTQPLNYPSSSGSLSLNPNRAVGTLFALWLYPDDGGGPITLDVSNWDHGEFTIDLDRKDYEARGSITEDAEEIRAFSVALTERDLDRNRPGWRTEKNILTGKPYKPGYMQLPPRLMRVERLELVSDP